MSPELERLLEAYHETLTCPPDEASQRAAEFDRLLNDVLCRRPGTSRAALLEALQGRYRDFCRARRKTTTLPPKA
jgi:hypothetical protein